MDKDYLPMLSPWIRLRMQTVTWGRDTFLFSREWGEGEEIAGFLPCSSRGWWVILPNFSHPSPAPTSAQVLLFIFISLLPLSVSKLYPVIMPPLPQLVASCTSLEMRRTSFGEGVELCSFLPPEFSTLFYSGDQRRLGVKLSGFAP